jgi:hypothetical protein
VQVRAGHIAAHLAGIREQVHVTAAQPEHLAAAQPRPRHQQHDQPVPRRAAATEHRDDVTVSGPVHRALRLMQPVPWPHPPARRAVLRPRPGRQVNVISDLEQQPHQVPRRGALGHRMHDHAADRRQDPVDPPC